MAVSSSLLPLMTHAAAAIRGFPGGARLVDGGALVLTLHRVSTIDPQGLEANEGLKVTPGYLELLIQGLRNEGYRFVSLDELVRRIHEGGRTARLACLTFDDGYQDNLEIALPLLERLKVPFAVYVTTAAADGAAFFWWFALGEFLLSHAVVRLSNGRVLSCRTKEERERTFAEIRGAVLDSSVADTRVFLLGSIRDFEPALVFGSPGRYTMSWDGIRKLAENPFATIGSHTMTHANLRSLPEPAARRELSESKARLEKELGMEVRHLAFPFGGRHEAARREYRLAEELGFATAATTLPGSIGRREVRLLHCLPRISVREGASPGRLIAENRARIWWSSLRRYVPA
jgi:peptidoglycan/xylan/chitin deacetylase (PgdA/CDA1 family)